MATFSISDTAFTGFGIVRHKPFAVLIWVGIQLAISIGFSAVMVTQFGPLLQQMAAMNTTTSSDPAQSLALLRQMAPFYGFLLVFSLIFYPVLFATMNRAVLRPSEDAFGYIRLGADELRQLALVLIYFVLAILAEIAVSIVAAILASVFAAALHQPGLVVALILVLVPFVLAALWVKLSLASAQTFATRKINVFGSWALTKGQFWPMAGTYVIAAILFLIVSLLGYTIIFAGAAMAGGARDILGDLAHPQMATASAFFTPARLVQAVLSAALGAITLPILMTPAPAIYRAIVGANTSPTVGL
jgi:hypothetical protein